MMNYLAHTAHWQFFGLVLAVLGLILTAATSGMDDWRVWYVDDMSVITSGMAWFGIWRACFYSSVLDTAEFCRSISITDSFIPPEIAAGQVMCMMAIPVGIAANLVAGYAVRRAYFNIDGGHIRLFFSSAGALYFLTATCSLIPVIWNMSSVLENRTIDFPPEFLLPPAPYKQELGLGIVMGIGSSVLLIISGLLFLSYRQTRKPRKHKTEGTKEKNRGSTNLRTGALDTDSVREGKENPAFKVEDML
ncbi:claudin-34 [Pangasianodon hypophthalmus]|uniref:claudin-34 n=1 Tax=Pangasianodon hypophthalmus TaxID=310915 RepID=UPI000EFED372|nr:claudin-34 [Pangasianodon hypophthalmus]XP_053083003.1 claudin-34 [Pangasianodon hypophthalmus]